MSKQPNVIAILADDMGYGDFSRFNDGRSSTPRLDKLIDESVCFTQSYTASPVCNPSRAAFLTGRYPHRTGSIDTLEWHGLERLALRERTLADRFKSAGYATGLVGKWHLGAYDKRYHPNKRGFDEAVCFRGGMHDYYRWRIERNDTVEYSDGRYLTDVWTDEAIGFVRRHQREPFFLHLTYNAPHTPLQAPVEDVDPFVRTGKFNKAVSTLYGMLRRMDRGIGRVLDLLEELGIDDNTIVFFSSDNGPQFGGTGEGKLDRFNCNFNGAKGTVYEGGIRVPMMIRWPDGLPRGVEVNDMVHFCDWYPTLLELAGLSVPEDNLPIDGRSVVPIIRGEEPESDPVRCWQWNRYDPMIECNAAIRDGDWKLIRPRIPEAMEVPEVYLRWLWVSMFGPEHFIMQGLVPEPQLDRSNLKIPDPQLYNIAEDPLEQNDLHGSEPERAAQLERKLMSWFESVESDRGTIDDEWGMGMPGLGFR